MDNILICQEILKGIITLVVGLAIARIGLWMYFRQKEYELVKQRYLEQCVDLIASELESFLGTFSHNWARCLQILKEYRDSEENLDTKQLSAGFLALNASKFQRIAHSRLSALTQSNTVWQVYQLALAFATSANAKAVIEVPETIRVKLQTNAIQQSHSRIVEVGFAEMEKLDEESHKFAYLLSALQTMATELEQQKLDFKSIRNFGKRPAVVKALAELNARFAEELLPYSATSAAQPDTKGA